MTGGLYRSWPHSSSDEAVVADFVVGSIKDAMAVELDNGPVVVDVDEVCWGDCCLWGGDVMTVTS